MRPALMPPPTRCFEILGIALARLSGAKSRMDDGRTFSTDELNAAWNGMEAEITDARDGQRYRISIEPISAQSNRRDAA